MGKKKFSSQLPDDDNLEISSREYTNVGEIDQEIEKLELKIPDKRTKEYQSWKEIMNFLIGIYNKQVGFKALRKYD